MTFLTVPGWHGSGPEHWQSIWERRFRRFERVEQADWSHPEVSLWIDQLESRVARSSQPVVLVAHSLGCLAVDHWVKRYWSSERGITGSVKAALLVAPPLQCPPEISDFVPAHFQQLPFPSLLVASRTDPYLPFQQAEEVAAQWGAKLFDAGNAGHLNIEADYGEWEEGERLLQTVSSGELESREKPDRYHDRGFSLVPQTTS